MTTSQHENFVSGDLIADRYKIERLLGKGGMGTVYLVSDTLLAAEGENPLLALKLINAELGSDERYRRRFLREVTLTREISHPNVVRTFEVGKHQEQLFFTMEYVEGIPLDKKLEGPPLTPMLSIAILHDIAKGLNAIHETGVLHRDLKPANILITKSGEVKISDFGIAKAIISDMTQQHEMLGSALYMSPEVWRGDEIGTPADIYSLGVMGYELLTGVVPFDGETEGEVLFKHLEQAVVPPLVVVPVIPAWANDLIIAMLAKDPEMRPDCEQIIRTMKSHLDAIESGGASANCFKGPRMFEGPAEIDEIATLEPDLIESDNVRERKTAEYIMEARRVKDEISLQLRNVDDGAMAAKASLTLRQKVEHVIRFSILVLVAPVIAWAIWELALPLFAAAWNAYALTGYGHLFGLSLVLVFAVALLTAVPIFIVAAFNANISLALELYTAVASRLAILSIGWYLMMHVARRIGFTAHFQANTFRAAVVELVQHVMHDAMRVGLLIPAPLGLFGGTSETAGITGMQSLGEGLAYGVVLALYLYGICGLLARELAFRNSLRFKITLWAGVAAFPQIIGMLLVAYLHHHPDTFLTQHYMFHQGPVTIDCNAAELATGVVTWSLIIIAGLIFSLRRSEHGRYF